MRVYAQTEDWTLYQGHVLDVLRAMPSESVHCVVTSPPYLGLRDYGLPPVVWGDDPDCEHEWGPWYERHERREPDVVAGKSRTTDRFYGNDPTRRFCGDHQKHTAGAFCQRCGAWLGQLGLEPTPELYVQHLVEVFREVRRVLRPDGTLWLNLGDSYAANRGCQVPDSKWRDVGNHMPRRVTNGLKPKDLIGIPWAVAFALRDDGWWLRRDIIWFKPNCMPESVEDRPTTAHEYVFLLTKAERYYYDAEAIREPAVARNLHDYTGTGYHAPGQPPHTGNRPKAGQSMRLDSPTRNRRSVWIVPTEPFPEAHFATFPTKLVEPMILAGCPQGGIVLDPFAGSGTTLKVAVELGRRAIGIELSETYCEMTRRRLSKAQPPLPLVMGVGGGQQ